MSGSYLQRRWQNGEVGLVPRYFVKLLSEKSNEKSDFDEHMLEDGETDEPETDNELKLSSKIAELFVMKKNGPAQNRLRQR